ncbi:MAG: nucleoside hydrolase [Eubacteriales bacterium]|nr:nucleoside hydrolase [Eubacteriales bacterium]MDY2602156.1 nucleoside hydrolase [Eubacteriales bacterium]
MNDFDMLKQLQRPTGKVKMVLDTDAYNEIDDQFAIAYALLAPEKIDLQAIYAAPFFNTRSQGPEDGMERSYDEILKLLRLAGREDMIPKTFKGSRGYLKDEKTPVESPAVEDLIEKARAASPEAPLYVVAIGAITNVASAFIKAPEVAKNTVVVWLGGHAWHWPDTREFNMMQDVAAARVIFDSEAALVQLPCMGVVSQCTVTRPELEYWLKGKNPLADYLAENTIAEAESYAAGTAWSRAIWDITTVAWIVDTEKKIVCDRIERRPIPEYDDHYGFDGRRPWMQYVWHINRDALFTDLFTRLTRG